MGAVHDFIDRLTTIPGTHARLESESAAKQQYEQAANRMREHQEFYRKQQETIQKDTQREREQLNRQTMRSIRGRIRGGIFGDSSQPPSSLSQRLG